MNDSAPLPSKRDVCVALLESSSVFVHLDPRKDGVSVPAWFRKQPQLVLQVGYQMAVPIPDLTVGDEALTGTLSFSRSPFQCTIPWSSVFALVSGETGRGMVWPPDVPPEVASQLQAQKPAPTEAAAPPAKPAKKARASRKAQPAPEPQPAAALAVPQPELAEPAEAPRSDPPTPRTPTEPSAKPKRELPPYLRVIK
ncbi:MAG: ClpXP protease specificity-enhancing factor SspB [Polyangiaceae bacterium]|jgi:stringent starvation protein B|nr:ClpXP protease specificity-enhancing factor SspB [Polyangiaceae bacterium]